MTHSDHRHYLKRAPRVSLPGTMPVTIQTENGRYIPGKLHRVSVTGGLVELVNYLDERTYIRLTIPFESGAVYCKAQMLFPMQNVSSYLQPFRLTAVSDEDGRILEREISALLRQAVVPVASTRRLGVSPPSFLLDSF